MSFVPLDLIWAVFQSALYSVMVFILPISVVVAALVGIASAVGMRGGISLPKVALSTFTVTFASLTVGYLTGASRETVSGDVLPIVISGFGALATYSVIKGAIPITVACGLTVLISAGLLAGTFLGAAFREYGPAHFQANQPPLDLSGEVQG